MNNSTARSGGGRKIVAIHSDKHAGHRLGLMSPAAVIYEEDEEGRLYPMRPAMNKVQEWLWEKYVEDLAAVKVLAGDDPIVSLSCGDETHGKKYAEELVSTRLANQIIIAKANAEEMIAVWEPEVVRFAEGTQSHEFGEGSTPILLTQWLADAFPGLDVQTVRHGLIDVDGATIDYAHHGPSPGIRKWTRGNVARLSLRSMMEDALDAGEKPPDLVVRGHRHTFLAPRTESIWRGNGRDVGGTLYESRVTLIPSYCGLSRFAGKVTQSTPTLTVGMIAVEIVGGRIIEIYPFVRTVDLRTKEVIRL